MNSERLIQIGSHKVSLSELSGFLIISPMTPSGILWSFIMFHPDLPVYLEYILNPYAGVLDFRFQKLREGISSIYESIPSSYIMISLKKEYSMSRGCIIWSLYDEPRFLGEYYHSRMNSKSPIVYRCKKQVHQYVGRPGDFSTPVLKEFPLLSQYDIKKSMCYFSKCIFTPGKHSIAVSTKQYYQDYTRVKLPGDDLESMVEHEKSYVDFKGRLFENNERVYQLILTPDFVKEYFG